MNVLSVDAALPIKAANAGLFISRGRGIHPTRVIDSHELIFVRQGVLSIAEEKRSFELRAGQTLLLWPGRQHRGTKPYPADLSFYWLHFYVVRRTGRELLRVPQQATIPEEERLTALLHRFLDDQESGRLRPQAASLLVMLMLHEIAAAPRAETADTSSAAALAARVEKFITTNFHRPISTCDIAREFNCNSDYLGRAFRRVTGHTIVDAIHRRRLRHARRLLLESTLNIEQIARESGFDDAGYFRRIFRRHVGISPLAHRRLYARMHVNTE